MRCVTSQCADFVKQNQLDEPFDANLNGGSLGRVYAGAAGAFSMLPFSTKS